MKGNYITKIHKLFCLFGLVLLTVNGQAQTLARHTWYYGNGPRGIKFNRVTNVATLLNNKANPFGTGGSSVASDHDNANVLFYTDGSKVFDISHKAMPNGTGLNGNTSS